MRAQSDHFTRQKSQPLADLMNKTAELERKLDDVRLTLEFELSQPADRTETTTAQFGNTCDCGCQDAAYGQETGVISGFGGQASTSPGHDDERPDDQAFSPQWRTDTLVNQGRHNSFAPGMSRRAKLGLAMLATAIAVTILVIVLAQGGASWPQSVATVQRETTTACQNPDVKSEPGQINFACAKGTRQILWVFALLTSRADPSFNDTKTGRLGLEPITPAQGSQVAWSLNLHHPYNPFNPIDSLEVAARAINNIIGGATLTGTNGKPIIQSGLESSPENCLRYTGSAEVRSHQGYPRVCAKQVTSPAGQAALVADVFQKWIVGAPPKDAQAAAVLFQNASNPGDPEVQAILKSLPGKKLA